jgi:hypothetical protein
MIFATLAGTVKSDRKSLEGRSPSVLPNLSEGKLRADNCSFLCEPQANPVGGAIVVDDQAGARKRRVGGLTAQESEP